MGTITVSSGRDCVLIILFLLYGSKAGHFEGNLIMMGQYDNQPSYWKKNESNIIQLNTIHKQHI